MVEELQALTDNDTFQLTTRGNKKTVGGRLVYSARTENNNCDQFKAGHVAKGLGTSNSNLQEQVIYYSETFSPTAKYSSIRILMNISARGNFIIHQKNKKMSNRKNLSRRKYISRETYTICMLMIFLMKPSEFPLLRFHYRNCFVAEKCIVFKLSETSISNFNCTKRN